MAQPITLTYLTVDVFTSTRYLGNPLAVVLVPASLRPRLTQDTKQLIAREFNFSETVFLHTLDDEARNGLSTTSREIDIFTIEEELPFAGHPTVGTAYLVLNHLGWKHVDTLVTKAGPIAIRPILKGSAKVKATIPHAVHVHEQTLGGWLNGMEGGETREMIEAALSDDPEIREAELTGPVVSIVRGMTFLLAKLPSLEHLAKVSTAKRLHFNKMGGLLDKGEWEGGFVSRYYYVPTKKEEEEEESAGRKEFKFRTRMVELGFEDPATGSAACALASYLTVSGKEMGGARFEVTQGVEMGRQSEIEVETTAVEGENGEVKVKDLYLGGTAVVVTKGSIYV